jgi:hypothetical protein
MPRADRDQRAAKSGATTPSKGRARQAAEPAAKRGRSRDDAPPEEANASKPRKSGVATPKDADSSEPKRKLRERMGHRVMKIPFLRRRYVNRMIKYIDKSKAKGRRLPPEMMELSRFLAQVPKPERAARLEEAIMAERDGEEHFNRDLRRAAANQQRRSGKGAGGYRPGAPPRSMQQGPRPPKKPR